MIEEIIKDTNFMIVMGTISAIALTGVILGCRTKIKKEDYT